MLFLESEKKYDAIRKAVGWETKCISKLLKLLQGQVKMDMKFNQN